jgi:hypothetical protein
MGLLGQRRLDDEVVRLVEQLIQRDGHCSTGCDVRGRHVGVTGNDLHVEPGRSAADCLCDRAERQQPERAAADPVDGLAGLPPPYAGPGRLVVPADLARGCEEEGHGMVGDLALAPVTGDVRDQDAAPRGGIDVDDVGASAVPGDHLAPGQRADRLRADGRVLGNDRIRVPRDGDDVVLAFALRCRQAQACPLDDRPLDVGITEVVVRDHDGLLPGVVSHFALPSSGVPIRFLM